MTPIPQTHAALAQRRFLAVQRVAEGVAPSQVAEVLGVHVETVRLWVRTHKAGGGAVFEAGDK